MRTFEEYLAEQEEINEGIREVGKKFKQMMKDFHAAKDIDTGFDELRAQVKWVLRRDLSREKSDALKRFLKGLDGAEKHLKTSKGRVKIGKLEKDFAPLLRSLNVGIGT